MTQRRIGDAEVDEDMAQCGHPPSRTMDATTSTCDWPVYSWYEISMSASSRAIGSVHVVGTAAVTELCLHLVVSSINQIFRVTR
jgi:hypothetical protein